MTKEIIALQRADEIVNERFKKGETNDLFIAKAVILLCMARKNRDADYVACNFMFNDRPLTEEEYEEFVPYQVVENTEMNGYQRVPDYVYDCHTWQGRRRGKTKLDMFRDENEALCPHQYNLFDDGSYAGWYDHKDLQGKLTPADKERIAKFQEGKVVDPTFNGTVWPPDERGK